MATILADFLLCSRSAASCLQSDCTSKASEASVIETIDDLYAHCDLVQDNINRALASNRDFLHLTLAIEEMALVIRRAIAGERPDASHPFAPARIQLRHWLCWHLSKCSQPTCIAQEKVNATKGTHHFACKAIKVRWKELTTMPAPQPNAGCSRRCKTVSGTTHARMQKSKAQSCDIPS